MGGLSGLTLAPCEEQKNQGRADGEAASWQDHAAAASSTEEGTARKGFSSLRTEK